MDCIGYGAHDEKGLLVPIKFKRRTPGPDDVTFQITQVGCAIQSSTMCSIKGAQPSTLLSLGGFSNAMVTHQRYLAKIPDALASEFVAPLLCAGITVYSPLMRYHMNQSSKSLGVIGLGGLSHMAVKFGKAFGLRVTVLSTSPAKEEEALTVLGADAFIVSKDEAAMKAAGGSLDFIVDTASGIHPLDPYLSLLKYEGIIAVVAAPPEMRFMPTLLFMGLKTVTGSVIGRIKEVQEMLGFCGEKGVTPIIETIPIDYANEALKRLQNNNVHY
ncbi:unnamed protein product [Sphagnum troendelagicum]